MASFEIPSGSVYTFDSVIEFDNKPPDQSVRLTNIEPGQKVRVTLIFQHRMATAAKTLQEMFGNGFSYFIEADAPSEMTRLGGGGTAGLPNAVQAHDGWTTAATVAYFQARSSSGTDAVFTMSCSPGDLGHRGAIMNLLLSAERL